MPLAELVAAVGATEFIVLHVHVADAYLKLHVEMLGYGQGITIGDTAAYRPTVVAMVAELPEIRP